MTIDTDHMTTACDGCGADPGEACTFPCLSWVTREEVEQLPLDVKVISDHCTPSGAWCMWSQTTVSPYYPHTTCPGECPEGAVRDVEDTSSASRQHFIDTGRYLTKP